MTYQISSNTKEPWAIFFKTPQGEERGVLLEDGDAILYKGCEIEHWRETLPSNLNFINRLLRKKDETYHHQVFFHYVRANGPRVHFANDAAC